MIHNDKRQTVIPHQKRPSRTNCPNCGEPCAFDVGCGPCRDVQRARHEIERVHPGEGLQHQNFVKFAGHLAAGLHSGLHRAKVAGFHPTRDELDRAAAWALEQFLGTGYVLPREPNGSMTGKQ